MAATPEGRVVKRAIDELNKLPETLAWKVHGDGRQRRGVSDIIVTHRGLFIAIEAKAPGQESNVSEAQERFLGRVDDAGGLAFVSSNADEMVNAVVAFGNNVFGRGAL
jgi:hypothetical protein